MICTVKLNEVDSALAPAAAVISLSPILICELSIEEAHRKQRSRRSDLLKKAKVCLSSFVRPLYHTAPNFFNTFLSAFEKY